MAIKNIFVFLFFILLFSIGLQAQSNDLSKSTKTVGSNFYRHLAFDFDQSLNKLYRFEKRGFGRAEIVTIVLMSTITGTPLKDYGNRRVKKEVKLRDLADEAGLDYPTLYKVAQAIKKGIEKKGSQNLPPPIMEKDLKRISEEEKKKEEAEKGKKDAGTDKKD